MSVFKRIISVSLAFSIIISMVTVVSAAELDVTDMASVLSWNSYVSSVGDDTTVFWSMMNSACADVRVGEFESMEKLQNAAYIWEMRATTLRNQLALKTDVPDPVIAFDASYGVYRIQDRLSGNYIVNASGRFAYYCDSAASVPDDFKDTITESIRKDTWLDHSAATKCKQVAVLSKDSLSDLAVTINQTDRTCSVRDTYINKQRFYIIIDNSNNIYANADGVPYVAHYEATATDVKYDYIVNEGNTTDNSQVIDLSNGTFNYIDESGKQEFNIDELIYDFSTQKYSADTYNVTFDNDTYNTYNYTWNITYNITNTYVTNIGQTELYQPLELYYQLPDGRSSADLTAEEVASMSFEFADCVNYAKSATDTYLRALYHFDGNTDDSSYFSTQGKFEWITGASITYMDVGTFDGALYLGPEAHEFKITLPSNIGSGDFTLQFRYYQEGAADTQANIENSLSIGGNIVLRWDEGYLYPQTSTASCSALSVGTWAELAVIRSAGTTYLYHNGLKIASFADTTVYSGNFSLVLGNTSRASSMIDELRVVNFAVAESGASYTCTSVPYDTNAILVLPDSAFPIADEYWDVKSSRTNILSQYGLDDWSGSKLLPSYFQGVNLNTGVVGSSNGMSPDGYRWKGSENSDKLPFPYFLYNNKLFSYSSFSDGFVFNRVVTDSRLTGNYSYTTGCAVNSTTNGQLLYRPSGDCFFPTYGVFSVLSCNISNVQALTSGNYTLSLVSASGKVSSVSFSVTDYNQLPSYTDSYTTNHVRVISNTAFGYEFGLMRLWTYDRVNYEHGLTEYLFVAPTSGNQDPIMYMELVQGNSTDLTAEWVTCMYSSEEVKPNTAAIQTDIPIKGYTVGGVRPTFPTRGDVWMPVSNNRISGCYIYNGTAWESVNARWYTGTRWIPIYAFDLTTLKDCWDIADVDTTIVMIATESQFWAWLQSAWQQMLDKLDAIIIALGGDPDYSSGSSGNGSGGLWDRIKTAFSDALGSIIESLMTFITDVLQLVLDLVYDLLSFLFNFLSTDVITGIANLFSSFTDGSLIVFFQQVITGTDENGNEVTSTIIALPDGIATAFAFFAGVITILPDELRTLLIFGIGALILVGILKLVKS